MTAWLALLVALGPLAGKLSGAERNSQAAFLPKAAQSTQVYQLQRHLQNPDASTAVVVFSRAGGLTRADRAAVTAAADRVSRLPLAAGAVNGPVASRDGQAAEFAVPMAARPGDHLSDEVSRLRQAVDAGRPGLTVHVTGPAGVLADSTGVFKDVDGKLLGVTLLVVIVLLLAIYRSPVLWLVPIAAAGAALVLAQAVAYLAASHAGLTVNGLSGSLLLILVFGAGTDYALLIVARYREELRRHPDKHRAMAIALARALPAVAASAATATLGLLCLLLSELNSNRGLGPVAVIGILSAFAVMTTLLPALLLMLPRAAFWPKVPRYGSAPAEAGGLWGRAGRAVARHPAAVAAGTVGILAVLALGLAGFRASGLTPAQQFTSKPDSVIGQQVLDAHFPAGTGSPVIVIARARAARPVATEIRATPGITGHAAPMFAAGYVEFQAIPAAPDDSPAAYHVVDRLRGELGHLPGAQARVGGSTATDLDIQRTARHDRDLIVPVVLGVILLVLSLLLRSLIAPLLLTATVALSFAASLGLSALVFTHVFHFAGADASTPLFVFIFLVTLGVDYNIFLMTRVREEAAVSGTRAGVTRGLAVTGGVITSAGLVLAATFTALTTIPLVTNVEIGFAVAVGVLLDTIVVRAILVPALALWAGPAIWWPGRLAQQGGTSPT